ncbi:MAG: cyanoglobin [Polyangiaceae bacterium]
MSAPTPPATPPSPFSQMGGDEALVRSLAKTFYDFMELTEPELTALHRGEPGKVSPESRERFALFLIGWLGGPQHYMERFGHPRLRMRHGHVPVSARMRDAWMRCMIHALDAHDIPADVRAFLKQRLAELADFLRNQAD